MSEPATNVPNAYLTDEEIGALLNHLLPHQLESKGGFNNTVFQSAVQSFYLFTRRGPPRRLSISSIIGKMCVCPDFMEISVVKLHTRNLGI